MKIEEVIKQLESILDHTRSMAAEADADGIWKEDIAALEFTLAALRSMPEAGEPLTVERLREMDGKPVWIEDVNRWRFVSIPEAGQFKNTPFVLFRKEDVQFEWQIEDSELTVYSYPPARIDRSKWTAEWVPMTDDDGCVWLECSTCEYDLDSLEESHPFCPSCGRAMTEEAWAELERRVRR